ncbi:unnamed protein product [Paramecium octaurelia]|uniref:NAD(P)(+)--arginine ADP-ribosyltransferase n=1 Tax=Paramecium octaurelia TaxID=43137 RepID=A0A8S1Y4M4_PAROT|nr:unnamed protein product [Paramecium octaurelia]
MFASLNQWKRVENVPPIADEICHYAVQNANQQNKIGNGEQNIVIFLDLKELGFDKKKAVIIKMSQIIGEFMKKNFKKYSVYLNTNNMYLKYKEQLLSKDCKFSDYNFVSNEIVYFTQLNQEQIEKRNPKCFQLLISLLNPFQQKPLYCKYVVGILLSMMLSQKYRIRKDIIRIKLYSLEWGIVQKKKKLQLIITQQKRLLCIYNQDQEVVVFLEMLQQNFLMEEQKQQIRLSQVILLCVMILNKKSSSSQRCYLRKSHLKNNNQQKSYVKMEELFVHQIILMESIEPHPNFCIEKLSATDLIFDSNERFINITTEYPNNFIAFDFLVHNLNKIRVEIYENREEFEVMPGFLVQNLKVIIEKKKGIPVKNQQLYFKGILMNDHFSLEDQNLQLNESEPDFLILKVINDFQGYQQAFDNNFNNNKNISIITHNQRMIKQEKQKNYYRLQNLKEQIERSFILCNGKPLQSKNMDENIDILKRNSVFKWIDINQCIKEYNFQFYFQNFQLSLILQQFFSNKSLLDLINVESIFLIDQQSGGVSIRFTLEINDQQLENVSQLKDSLQWLRIQQINKENQIINKSIFIVQLQKLNNDLRISDYSSWKEYLRYLIEGLRYMKYYKGVAYRGIRDYQNTSIYRKGKVVQWSEVTSISLDQNIAQYFSNNKGMIFSIQLISAKNISNISIYEGEQELIMYPFSTYVVDEVEVKQNQPYIIKMREFPLPRSHHVLLWVDDNPENNYNYAQEIEIQHNKVSVIFCTSTKDAILIIQKYKWMIYLSESQFRVISDMVRIEDGQPNQNTGIELLCHLYQQMKYKNITLIFCGNQYRAEEECKSRNIKENFEITNNQNVLEKFSSI